MTVKLNFFCSSAEATDETGHHYKNLGGSRSAESLGDLFHDLTPKQSRAGLIDYRCFYVKNTGDDMLRNAKLYIDWEKKSGSFVDVGVKLTTEIQKVEVFGPQPPNENDHMKLHLETYGDFQVPYYANITQWQGTFQTAIRALDGLQDVRVTVAGEIGFPTDVVFTVMFIGQANSRKLQTMTVLENNLNAQTISIVQIKEGSPISITACTIPKITIQPVCVDFDYPLRGNPIELGDLRPNDEFPVWLRRTTPKETRIGIEDKVRINIDGTFP